MENRASQGYQTALFTGQKRQHPTTENAIESPIKHRSSRACQSCRTRKVRCDVIRNDSTCTNCRLDGLQCVVLPSQRGKRRRHDRDTTVNVVSSPPDGRTIPVHESRTNVTEQDLVRSGRRGDVPATTLSGETGQVPTSVTFDQDDQSAINDQQAAYNNDTTIDADINIAGDYNGLLTPGTGPHSFRRIIDERAVLPPFIAPLPKHLPHEDVEYLVQKGSTIVPEPDLQVEILRGYLFSVHPFMPMLNFRSFIGALLNYSGQHQISLLLFQAVMFAGLHSLPLNVIQRLGFETTKEARKVYFNRVKLLYEFDVESDDAAVLQSLILMSSWYDTWHDRRHTWHWTGLAFDIARNMGLHREPAIRYTSHQAQRFRRRLWWSLYIRDRMIALGTRRPMRIRDDQFDVEMLTLDDFDIGREGESNQSVPLLPDVEENVSTALMCIELAKLCVFIGRVTSSQYTTLSRNPDVPHTMMIVSKQDGDDTEELERCDQDLNEWYQALEKNVRRDGRVTGAESPQSCSEVHWAMLKIAYLTTVNVLHRGRALQCLSGTADFQIAQRSSRTKLKDAARRITKDSQLMLAQDQVRFFGLLGVTALVAASLSHLLDISSGDDDVRDASTFRLFRSLEVLQCLRSIYASADAAVSFLASVTRTAGITIPAHFAVPAADFISATSSSHVQPGSHSAGFLMKRSFHPGSQTNITESSWSRDAVRNRNDSHRLLEKHFETHPSRRGLAADPSTGITPSAELAVATNYSGPVSTLGTSDAPRPVAISAVSHEDGSIPGELLDLTVGHSVSAWNYGIESGMGLFNYDFYSNAYGFSDGIMEDT